MYAYENEYIYIHRYMIRSPGLILNTITCVYECMYIYIHIFAQKCIHRNRHTYVEMHIHIQPTPCLLLHCINVYTNKYTQFFL